MPGVQIQNLQFEESFVSSLTFLRTLLLEVNIIDPNKNYFSMGLYFNRLFLRDRYSIAPGKFGQKPDSPA